MDKKKLKWLAAIFFLLAVLVCSCFGLFLTKSGRMLRNNLLSQFMGKGQERAQKRFQDRLEARGQKIENLDLKIVVRKRQRILQWFNHGIQIATFPVALGDKPEGNKSLGNDGKTPEGDYFICYKKENSRYHLFMAYNYPSPDDAAQACSDGRITASEAESILDASIKQSRPIWSTPLGGPAGLHGFGTGEDWTEGTIALANSHIEELFWNTPLKTPIQVLPE
ncbi:MAG: L,D-transpeptidase [Candidatus Riflebacteria bacterium]|nr:L,D-transpeptidase [Candidatus Riflebacteria bacterium]